MELPTDLIYYIENFLPLIPVYGIKDGICECSKGKNCTHPGKHPRIKDWRNKATTDRGLIQNWLNIWPNSNWAVLTGAETGIIIIDVDPRNGGHESLETLAEKYPEILNSFHVLTGGGGLHIYLAHPGGTIKSRPTDLPGIDIKADGGAAVIPPSLHASGNRYHASDKFSLNDIVPCPPGMLDYLNKKKNQNNIKLTDMISRGQRNEALASAAGRLRRFGMSEEKIREELLKMNTECCDPPLPEEEVAAIASSIARYDPAVEKEGFDITTLHLTDLGLAEYFIHNYGMDIGYLVDRDKWIIFEQHFWRLDNSKRIDQMAIQATRKLQREIADLSKDDKKAALNSFAIKSENDGRANAMLNRAKCHEDIIMHTSNFDNNDFLLGCENGVLDLKTDALRPGRREDKILTSTNVIFDASANCDRFLQFLDEIFDGDQNLISFIQRCVGYSLTGSIDEQVLFMCYGQGANGKSVFLNVLRDIMGEYASTTGFSTLASFYRSSGRIPNDIAALQGKRIVTVSEAPERARWDEGRVKSLTGGDVIQARFLHREFFEFIPKFKLWLAVNHKPKAGDTSEAFWRRVLLIPFNVQIPADRRDKYLQQKLRAELGGIFNWAIEGTLMWLAEGLNVPESVRTSTKEYRSEEDVIQNFLEQCTLKRDGSLVAAGDLYTAFASWCHENGEKTISNTMFGRKLSALGLEKRQSGTSRRMHYCGIGLLPDPKQNLSLGRESERDVA